MRTLAAIALASLLVACADPGELTDEECTLIPPDECEAQSCGSAVAMRQIVVDEPKTDDDCFGARVEMCVRQPELYENSANCIYAWRRTSDGPVVLRLNSAEVPRGWKVCHGGDDEPPACACHDVGGCSR